MKLRELGYRREFNLSELIEDCLEIDSKRESNTGHISLNRSPHVATDANVWFANTLRANGSGKTAEEAIANLWLALQKQ